MSYFDRMQQVHRPSLATMDEVWFNYSSMIGLKGKDKILFELVDCQYRKDSIVLAGDMFSSTNNFPKRLFKAHEL